MSRRGYFGGMNGSSPVDYAARYTQDMQMPTLPLNMESIIRSGSSRDPGADDRLESALQKAVREGEGTITGYVYGYDNRVRKIKDLLQNDERNFIEAENLYKDLQTVASANQDALLTLSGYGNSRSVTAKALADSAAKLKSGSYNDEVVTLSDGRQTSIGQLFGGSGYMANRSRQLSRYGFGANVSEAYLGEDADKSEAVGMFVLPVISGPRIDASNSETRSMQFSADVNPYRIQMNDGAAFVADNYDRMRSRLGVDGTRRLIQDVMKNQGNSGGMTYMMRGIMDYLDKTGEKDADGTPVPIANGYKWVSDFTSAYNETYQALFKDPKSPSPAGYDERQNQFSRSWNTQVPQETRSSISVSPKYAVLFRSPLLYTPVHVPTDMISTLSPVSRGILPPMILASESSTLARGSHLQRMILSRGMRILSSSSILRSKGVPSCLNSVPS